MDTYLEPLKNYRFKVIWDDRAVAGITRVTALRRTTEVVRHNEGGDPLRGRKSPGKTEYEPVVLERGVSQDRAFEEWAQQVWSLTRASPPPRDFRRDVTIEVYDDAGSQARSFKLYRCWVSEYQALSDLDASAGGVLIETIRLEHEGWEQVEPGQGDT